MTKELWQRNEDDSPCVRVCLMHPLENLCIGCYRTPEEIENWPTMEQGERAQLRKTLPERAPRLLRRKGGRANRIKAANQP